MGMTSILIANLETSWEVTDWDQMEYMVCDCCGNDEMDNIDDLSVGSPLDYTNEKRPSISDSLMFCTTVKQCPHETSPPKKDANTAPISVMNLQTSWKAMDWGEMDYTEFTRYLKLDKYIHLIPDSRRREQQTSMDHGRTDLSYASLVHDLKCFGKCSRRISDFGKQKPS